MTNRPLILPYNGQVPHVPQGFTATPFATGLVNPRRLLVLPNGDVLLAEQSAGYLTLLRDTTGSGRADFIERHVEDLNRPYGLAWRDGYVLVADQDGIWRVPHQLGALRAGRAVRRHRLIRQSRRRARAEGFDPAFRCGRLEPDDVRVRDRPGAPVGIDSHGPQSLHRDAEE